MAKKSDPIDHGTFTLSSPRESVMLVQLMEQARKNTKKPGHAWGRIEGSRTVDGRTEVAFKVYHVDLNTNRLTITQEQGGLETARLTVDLASPPTAPEVEAGPTAPPDPGPDEPAFRRYPFRAADILPVDELRDWAMARADEDVVNLSVLPRRIRLFGEGFQEEVTLPKPFAAHVAPGTGATLRALRRRPGVERALVEGWFGSVDGRGTAWILEVGDDEDWWLAMRTFARRPGDIGAWTSAWSSREGSDVASLTSLLHVVVAPPAGETPIPLGSPTPPSPPDFGMFIGALPPGEAVPNTAADVADRVGREWEANLPLGKRPEGPRLTVFRGSELESWVLDGPFPMGLDDMIRAICARGEVPASIALVHMGVLPFEGEVYRALLTDGEAGGRRHTRAMLIRMAPSGRILGYRIVYRDHGAVGDDGWIGVAPITEMSLFALGAGEG